MFKFIDFLRNFKPYFYIYKKHSYNLFFICQFKSVLYCQFIDIFFIKHYKKIENFTKIKHVFGLLTVFPLRTSFGSTVSNK